MQHFTNFLEKHDDFPPPNMVDKFNEVFIDDLSIFNDSFDNYLSNLARVLKQCVVTNLVLN